MGKLVRAKKIDEAVERIIEMYMEEDFDYAEEEMLKGRNILEELTIEQEMEFITRNNNFGFPDMTDKELKRMATQAMARIKKVHGKEK